MLAMSLSTTISSFSFQICPSFFCGLMASSSRNPIPLTALDDEESLIHDFDHISLHSPNNSNSFCLFFKLLSPKSVKPSWIEKAMTEAWTLRFPVQISEYHSGLFLASFQCDGDRRRVLEEQSWPFDKFLMVFTHPDVSPTPTPESVRYVPFWIHAHRIPFGRKSPQLAQFIADEIGELIEIFPLSLLENFGPYLGLQVLFNITKPLRRGMTIRFRGINDPKWISFKYESLPNFCDFCGLVDHTYKKCAKYLLRCDNFAVPPALEYKESLRATTSAQHKRNLFELSNSIPYEEYFPRTKTDDQSLQQAVDQFFRVDSPVSIQHHIQLLPLPRSRGSKGVVISEPRPTASPGLSSGTRRPFTRQTVQVGDSVRSMLKRARAVVSEDAVVPSIDRNSTNSPPPYAMHHFHSFLDKFNHIPLHHSSPKFTWRHGQSLEHLDWCTSNQLWQNLFPHPALFHLGFCGSDHRALKVKFDDIGSHNRKSSRFHMENHWRTDPSFVTLIQSSWTLPTSSFSSPLQNLLDRQSICLSDIKTWSRSQYPLQLQNSRTQAELHRVLNDTKPTPQSLTHAAYLLSELDGLLHKDEVYWKQRARVDWLRAGDKNTKFFHRKASIRRKNNFIRNITLPDGSISHDSPTIISQFLNFYTNLFSSQGVCDVAINSILQGISPRLSPEQSVFLDGNFTEAEIKQALFSLLGDKAPGPDGLNPLFY
uniref:DUF4283 domain-containing protein n=1 Tax=Cannabis sativa TaxID=3483 RepID=A0A803NH20_CANSA